MNTQFWIIQAFNGISYGALLFLVGSGLSLIFGVMRIVNLSHGAYFLWGGYIALSVIQFTGSWALSIPVAAFAVALIGIAMERLFLRSEGFEYLRNSAIALGIGILVALAFVAAWPQFVGTGWGKFLAIAAVAAIAIYFILSRLSVVSIDNDVLRQVLLTVGFAFLFQQDALDIWGGNNMDITPPAVLSKSLVIAGIYFPAYRIFMIALALVIGVALWLAMEKTRMGAAVRATVDDAQMARGVGFEMLPLAFAVVIIGGMGSLGGAAIGALAVGLADNFGKALFPEVSYFTLYAPMVLILAIKPTGLFGRD